MAINKKRVVTLEEKKRAKTAHKNWMGGQAWDVKDSIKNLRLAAASCFFGEPQYYHRDDEASTKGRGLAFHATGRVLDDSEVEYLRRTLDAIDPSDWRSKSPKGMLETAIDVALEHDPEATLRVAAELRNEDHIRTTPQVILVRAANLSAKLKGTGLIRRYAQEIIKRADEPAVQLAYQLSEFGRENIPNSLKKAWKDSLERLSKTLAKYRMESRGVKTIDVINLCHPSSHEIDLLAKGQLKLDDNTWESYISKHGSSKESWEKAVDLMYHQALLRNLRNLTSNGVDPNRFVGKLVSTAAKGQQLPFRYYSAYLANEGASPLVLGAIEECLEISLSNMSHIDGRTMSLVDNSGSAWGATTSSMGTMQVARIGNLTGAITAKISDEGYVGVFGDRLRQVSVSPKSSIFDITKNLDSIGQGIGHGTENGIWLFWDQAIKNKEHWDNVFVYSDMQAGHGGLYGLDARAYSNYRWPGLGGRFIDVPKLITEYRRKVNPNVNVFLVQIAGYQDTIVPEYYDRCYILGGWGDGILRFASRMASLNHQ